MIETLYYSFAPEIILSTYILVLLSVSVNWTHSNNFLLMNNIITLQCLGILFVVLYVSLSNTNEISTDLLVQDEGTKALKNLLLLHALPLVLIIGQASKFQELNFPEFMCLFLFTILSFMLLISANDLLLVYLVLELQSVTFYAMTGFKRSSSHSTDASMKYFVFGAVFSCIFVFGCSLLYFGTGTLNLDDSSKILIYRENGIDTDYHKSVPLFLGSLAVLTVLTFKLGLAPFLSWAPDVYEGAPLGATIAITVLPKISLLFFALKWICAFEVIMELHRTTLVIFSMLTIVWSTGLALQQKRVKRLLVYSSLSQTGFLCLALSTSSSQSFVAVYTFLFSYVVASSLIWAFTVWYYTVQKSTFIFQNVQKLRSLFISDLANLLNKNSIECLVVVGVVFSIGGMPPSIGFLAKYLILSSVVEQEFFIVSGMVVIASSFAYFYYLRVIKILVFEIKTVRTISSKLKPEFADDLSDAYCVFMVSGVFLLYSFMYLEPVILLIYFIYFVSYLF